MTFNKNITYLLSNDSINRLNIIDKLTDKIKSIKLNTKINNLFNNLIKEYEKKDFFILNELNYEEKHKIKTHIQQWMKKYMGTDIKIYNELDKYIGKIYHLQTKDYPYFNLYFVGENVYMAELLLKRAIVLNRLVKDFKYYNLEDQLKRINRSECNIECDEDIHTNKHVSIDTYYSIFIFLDGCNPL